jgi:hypothetical protein
MVTVAGVAALVSLGGAAAQTIDGEQALLNHRRVHNEIRAVKGARPIDGERALLNRHAQDEARVVPEARRMSSGAAVAPIDGRRALLGLTSETVVRPRGSSKK